MSRRALVVLVAAFLLVHDWYPYWCCGGNDCHEIPCSDVREVKGGYMVHELFFSSASPSPDGHCHACATGATTHCLFIKFDPVS